MIKFWVVLLLFFTMKNAYGIENNDEFIECFRSGIRATKEYWNENYSRQISDLVNPDDRYRNLCFAAMDKIVRNCEFYRCLVDVNLEKRWQPFGMDLNLTGDDVCEMKKIDCFKDDINKVKNILKKTGDSVVNVFLFDMDAVVDEIRKNNPNIHRLDANKAICYSVDSNGDSVWHAFVQTSNFEEMKNWMSLCISLSKSEGDIAMFLDAVLWVKNFDGKTAVYDAIKKGNLDEYLKYLSWWVKQEVGDCKSLAENTAEEASVDTAVIKSVLCK